MKRKIPTAMIIAAILIVALAATALAIGLRRTQEADTVVKAREALMKEYGLTSECIGCFNYRVMQEGDTWVVTFTGAAFEINRLGSYTVYIPPNEAPKAEWSYDTADASLWQEGNLDAPVWGPKQILQRLQMSPREWDEYLQGTALPPPIEQEADDRSLLISTPEVNLMFLRVAPDESDISEEEALAFAKQAMRERYAISDTEFDNSDITVALAVPAELGFKLDIVKGGVRQYVVIVRFPSRGQGTLYTLVGSGDREILACIWDVSIHNRSLPKERLGDYRAAVAEFLSLGAFVARPDEEKIEIVERMESEGLDDLIQRSVSEVLFVDQQADKEKMLDVANEAMVLAYGLRDEALALFSTRVSIVHGNGKSYSIVEYWPSVVDTGWGWNWDLFVSKGIGTYTVLLEPDIAGARIVWSKAGVWDNGEYTENTWGAAPAYHAKLFPWVLDLRSGLDALTSKYPAEATMYDYSFEDQALFDTLFREAGIDANQFSSALPEAGDLSYEEAFELAEQAVLAEMPAAFASLEDADVTAKYDVGNADERTWRFSFFFIHDGVEVGFGVAMDAKTGEVFLTNVVTGGNG